MKTHFRNFLVTALILPFVLVFFVSGCQEQNKTSETVNTDNFRTLEAIKASGTVKIGVFSDKAPFGYVNQNGQYKGYDVYFANKIAEDLGVEVEFVPLDAKARVDSLIANKVDIVLANFTVTDERKEKVDFALPYQQVQIGIVSPDSSPVSSINDLTGKKLVIVKGTTAETFFEKNYPNVELLKYETYADVAQALLDSRGAAWATDNTEAWGFAKDNKGFSVPSPVANLGDKDTIAPAVAKGNTSLLNWLNLEIKSLGTTKFFHQAYDKELASIYGKDNADIVVIEGGKAS